MSSDDGLRFSFSQRIGLVPAIKLAQVDDIDSALKNAIWNVLTRHCFSGFSPSEQRWPDRLRRSNFQGLAESLYGDFYKTTLDALPSTWSGFIKNIRESYFKLNWHRVYSFIEFIVELNHRGNGGVLVEEFNKVLVRESSAYRFVAGKLTPITSLEEIAEIEKALSASDKYSGVRVHLQTSLGLLTDKQNPDYRNSIKESISSVECLVRKIVGDEKATLGQALKEMEKKHGLHPALKMAFQNLYGYTNDAEGIRHSLMDDGKGLTTADARFMLVCCSAFINFAIDSTRD